MSPLCNLHRISVSNIWLDADRWLTVTAVTSILADGLVGRLSSLVTATAIILERLVHVLCFLAAKSLLVSGVIECAVTIDQQGSSRVQMDAISLDSSQDT